MKNSYKTLIRKYIYITLGKLDKLLARENNLVIYCYHNIHTNPWAFNVNKNSFNDQMNYLAKWGEPVTLNQIVRFIKGKTSLPKKSFAITFDDGYQGVLSVQEIVKKYGIRPTIFILPSDKRVDRNEIGTKAPFLNNKQIKQLKKQKWDIGSHGISHKKLTKVNSFIALKELQESKSQIQKNIRGKSVEAFSYPHGAHSNDVQKLVDKANYKLAVSLDDEHVSKQTNIYNLSRVGVMGNHTMGEFVSLASPSVLSFRKIIKNTPLRKFI